MYIICCCIRTLKKNTKLLTLYNNKPQHQETNTIKNGTNRINRNTELPTLYNIKNQHQELNRIKMKQTELNETNKIKMKQTELK
jgi:hypothetical protein